MPSPASGADDAGISEQCDRRHGGQMQDDNPRGQRKTGVDRNTWLRMPRKKSSEHASREYRRAAKRPPNPRRVRCGLQNRMPKVSEVVGAS